MQLEIKELRKKDYKHAIQAAIKGMHFDWYLNNKLLLHLYGKYFWYLELTRATQVIAAYAGEIFAGVLLAEIKGEEKSALHFGNLSMLKSLIFCKIFLPKTVQAFTTKQTKNCFRNTVKRIPRMEKSSS